MTLIEVLIGNMLLVVVIFASLNVFKDVVKSQSGSENQLNLIVTRNRLLSQILDGRTWEMSAAAAENTALGCMVDQDHSSLSDRNCKSVANASVNLYALDNQLAFALQQPGFGLNSNGVVCSSYVAAPAAGDRLCPVGVSVSMTALCDAGPATCFNPPFLVSARHAWNGDSAEPKMRVDAFDFDVITTGFYCPAQSDTVAWVGNANITVNGASVDGINNGAQVGSYAQTDPLLLPCRQLYLGFTINTGNYSVAQVNNTTTICLADEGLGTCGFSFALRRLADGSFTYDLLQDAAVVASKPSWMTLTGNESYEIQVTNGLVKFCIDSRCLTLFEAKLEGPFRIRAYPAWSTAVGQPIVENLLITSESLW